MCEVAKGDSGTEVNELVLNRPSSNPCDSRVAMSANCKAFLLPTSNRAGDLPAGSEPRVQSSAARVWQGLREMAGAACRGQDIIES